MIESNYSAYFFRAPTVIEGRECWPIYDCATRELYGYLLCKVKKMSWEEAKSKQTEFWQLTRNMSLLESIVEFMDIEGSVRSGVWRSDGVVFKDEPTIEDRLLDNYAVFIHRYTTIKMIRLEYYFKNPVIMYGYKCWPIYSGKTGLLVGYLSCEIGEMSITEAKAKQSKYWHLTKDKLLLEAIANLLIDNKIIYAGDDIWQSDGEVFNMILETPNKEFEELHDNFAVFVHLL